LRKIYSFLKSFVGGIWDFREVRKEKKGDPLRPFPFFDATPRGSGKRNGERKGREKKKERKVDPLYVKQQSNIL